MEEVAAADTRLESVTIYARGARVRRTASLTRCPAQVRITGLPLAVIEDTVRISIDGPALATAVRVGIATPPAATAPEETSQVREAKRLVAVATAELARLEGGLERLAASSILAADPTDEPPAAWAAIVAARRSVLALRTERELALRAEITAAQKRLADARVDLEVALDQQRANPARDARPHELRKRLDIELAASGEGAVVLHVEYMVVGARWAPSYVARLDGARASLEVRAVVAQDTGEDWRGAKLVLSTAEPARFAQLPELAAQRIGRKQAEPARRGFRPPPAGAEALYADYQQHVDAHRSEVVAAADRASTEDSHGGDAPYDADDGIVGGLGGRAQSFAEEVWDEESSAAKERFATPPRGSFAMDARSAPANDKTPVAPMAAPASMTFSEGAPEKARKQGRASGGAGMKDRPTVVAKPAPGAPSPLLDYGNLIMADVRSPARGRLIAMPVDGDRAVVARDIAARRDRIEALALPPGCTGTWSHAYDYAYATDGEIEVASDGAWHSIAVTQKPATVQLRHVAVPREQADVFRIAAIANPFPGPLLPGPIDVYDHAAGAAGTGRGRFLVTSSVEQAPPGATLEIGLGVDAAVKIARNTEFREEAAGMLRGSLKLHHSISIEVDNVSAQPIELEVRERIPVTREGDDDIEVEVGRVEPAWEPWRPDADGPRAARLRRGYRWRLALPANTKRTLRATYEIKIPSRAELIGGNRRES